MHFVLSEAGPGPGGQIRVVVIDGRSSHFGTEHNVERFYFRTASAKEVEDAINQAAKSVSAFKSLGVKMGSLLELTDDIKVDGHGPMGSGIVTIRRGTECVADIESDPNIQSDDGEYDAGDVSIDRGRLLINRVYVNDFMHKKIKCYFPEAEIESEVSVFSLKSPKIESMEKLVLPQQYMQRLTVMSQRVLKQDVSDGIYNRLGLSSVCRKGRGMIALLYGPPGTGKTATAEWLARSLGRAMIRLSISVMEKSLPDKMQAAFTRAKRYGAILLLDEVDVFIKKRGAHIVSDESTSIFLRALEYYDGILIMTTNLHNDIDSAIFSRVHVCLEYGITTDSERAEIWNAMMPEQTRQAMRLDADGFIEFIKRLSVIPINGREIKTAIQNSVTRAMAQRPNIIGNDDLLSRAKWINPALFLEEANAINELKKTLGR